MRSRKPRRDLGAWCGQIQPDDGIDPREAFSRPSRSRTRTDRKGQQLCRQAFRVLTVTLSGCRDALLQDLEVLSVDPAPDSTHLLVTVRQTRPAANSQGMVALERLQAARGFLRAEIASAITRRRAPDLSFRLVQAPEVQP